MDNTRKFLVLVLLIAGLGACMLGPDYQKPEFETPPHFRFDAEKAGEAGELLWWELFDDPVLHSLVMIALNENKNVLIAASRMEEARAALGFIKADLYPRIDIEASAARGDLAGRTQLESVSNQFFLAPVLNWEIDFWGKYRRANEAAAAEMLATAYGLRTVQIGLISEVAGTYFLLLDYKQRLRISQNTLESRLDSLDIMQKRFDRGYIPELDLNQAQIQKEIAAAAIPVFERLVAKTENALGILLGRLPGTLETGVDLAEMPPPPVVPAGLSSTLLERRPDIIQAEYILMAQTARIGVAEALRFPSINLTGILGVASDELSSLTDGGPAWNLTGSLFGPLFNAGKNKRRVEIEEERTRQALYVYEDTVLLAFREVEDALVEVQTYEEQLAAVEQKMAAAANASQLSRERYDQGVTSYLEVLDTERTLFNVELELSQLRQEFRAAYVRLYKALGGGWISEAEREQARDPEKKTAQGGIDAAGSGK
jgi:multidrug efflux system outer membrane protein